MDFTDLSLLRWLWHDSVLLAIDIRCRDGGLLDVAFACEIHPDEDRAALIALGIRSARVRVVLRDAFDLAVRRLASTADREVITEWEISGNGPVLHHRIGLSTGAEIECFCRRLEIYEWQPAEAGQVTW